MSAGETYEPELPMDRIDIGKGQMRTHIDELGLQELAHSISVQGQLEPVVVCQSNKNPGRYELLAGQRRFLASERLGLKTIKAIVRPPVDDLIDQKAISATENLLKQEPTLAEKIDTCTDIYNKYGSIKIVVAKTGIPEKKVRDYVKIARLHLDLQPLVKEEGIDIAVALRAQDAASVTGTLDVAEAKKLAIELANMSGAVQTKLVKQKEGNPDADTDELIEAAKGAEKIIQLNVKMSMPAHARLKRYAKEMGTTLDDAARDLIEDGLTTQGYTEDSLNE
jgi:ParB family transcriptional regulator, chromosome partitioning protein